jgi:hypothetical protein
MLHSVRDIRVRIACGCPQGNLLLKTEFSKMKFRVKSAGGTLQGSPRLQTGFAKPMATGPLEVAAERDWSPFKNLLWDCA